MIVKYILILFLGFNILSSNENVVKTSELELFLFKIGFESLLKDVEINKDKTTLNAQEIKTINEKINLIMNELYKKNQVLLNDSNEKTNVEVITKTENKELENLKEEIAFLKQSILELKKNQEKNENIKEETIENIIEEKDIKSSTYIVISSKANIYKFPFQEATILKTLKRDDIVNINSCNQYGWCKLKDSNSYIKAFLISPNSFK